MQTSCGDKQVMVSDGSDSERGEAKGKETNSGRRREC